MKYAMLPAILLMAGCSTTMTPPMNAVEEVALAKMKRADGSDAGVATLTKQDNGIWLELSTEAPGQGSFGVHLHSVGKCDAPDFASAGPHWNPTARQHGKDNPAGAHAGDLPNLQPEGNGRLYLKTALSGAQWDGAGGLFDADGISIIVHEKADDYKTDPSGNSGKRIFCGMFEKG